MDESTADPRALEINKWSDEKRRLAIDAAKAYETLKSFIRGFNNPTMILHNAPFDLSLIKAHSERVGVQGVLSGIPFVDTKKTEKLRQLVKGVEWPRKISRGKEIDDNTLASLARQLGIDNEDAHTALADAEALMKLFLKFAQLAG